MAAVAQHPALQVARQRFQRLVQIGRAAPVSAQRQHRHRQRRVAQFAVLQGVLVRRAVVAQHAAQAAQRLVDAFVLVDVGGAEHAGLVGRLAAEEPLDQDALAPLQQRLGQIRHRVEQEVPALPVVRPQLDGGFERHAGNVGVQQHHPLHLVGMARGIRIGDPGADIVAGEAHSASVPACGTRRAAARRRCACHSRPAACRNRPGPAGPPRTRGSAAPAAASPAATRTSSAENRPAGSAPDPRRPPPRDSPARPPRPAHDGTARRLARTRRVRISLAHRAPFS